MTIVANSTFETLGAAGIDALFVSPSLDGAFDGLLGDLAAELGHRRPLVLIAFAPRTAGTFLRTAAIEAIDGQLMRFVHAEGGRDASLYLPWLVAYFSGALTADTAVTHVHMQAATANRNFMDAFDLHPCVMRRSIPDSLRSLLAMMEDDPGMPIGFSFLMPPGFAALTQAERADALIDLMGPWYAQYYASWKAYADETPGRVLITDYVDFCDDPAGVLELILAHARDPRPFTTCDRAIAAVWQEREKFRCNRERPHHTAPAFTPAQRERLARFVSYYPTLEAWRGVLLSSTSD